MAVKSDTVLFNGLEVDKKAHWKANGMAVEAAKLPPACRKLFDAMVKTIEAGKTARAAFETAVIAESRKRKSITADQALMFTYRFGFDPFRVAPVDLAGATVHGNGSKPVGRSLF